MKDILLHSRRLRASLKDFTLDELELLSKKIKQIITRRKDDNANLMKTQQDKLGKIEEIRKQMKSIGISISELDPPKTKRKNTPRPPKYAIVVAGEKITWTGQGRLPNIFKAELNKGKTLDDFLI
jgi:DNA-binding protein H-NS